MQHHNAMITGRDAAGDARTEVRCPWDQQVIATVEECTPADAQQALDTAAKLFQNRRGWLTAETRIEILERAAALLLERIEEFALRAAGEGGKPLIDSRIEISRAVDGLKSCAECIRTHSGREIPMGINAASSGRIAMTRHEPIGVVVAVSAFNHPLNLIVHQAGPAVAGGCPVIIKPASDTPLSCLALAELLVEAGLPPGWCQVVTTQNNAVAEALVTDPRIAFFSFIGSAGVGWMLRSKLAPGTRCALEHGGAAPVIVAADADLEDAVPLLAKGGYYHAGQVCVSVQRVFAHHSVARSLAQELADRAQTMKVGDPRLGDTEIGPLIRPREINRVAKWVEQARQGGAEILTGGTPIGETCYQPTLLYNPPPTAEVSQKEIFGPVVCVYPYQDLDAAIAQANSLPFAFQAAVFSRDLDTALHCYRHLAASAVMVNDHTAFRVDWMPFAGLRQSGLGVGGIPYTFEDMQVSKMLMLRSPAL